MRKNAASGAARLPDAATRRARGTLPARTAPDDPAGRAGEPHREIELKLTLDPAATERLRRHALVRSLATGRARIERLVSTYFDTPEFGLRRRGLTLRVRRIGERRVQTLKLPDSSPGMPSLHRDEYETETRGLRPDLARLGHVLPEGVLEPEAFLGGLRPVFATEMERRRIPLRLAGSDIMLALDLGRVRAGRRHEMIAEAELELVSGDPARLYELALALHEQLPFRLESRSKASRGYALLQPEPPRMATAEPVRLGPEMSVAEAFTVSARACLAHLRANEPVVLAGNDPGGVHQMRVATRRLRALVGAFRSSFDAEALAFLKQELRWLQSSLGGARDWDVFTAGTLTPVIDRFPDATGLAAMRDAATELRAEAYAAAQAAVRDGRYTTLLLRLGMWLEDRRWLAPSDAAESPSLMGLASDVLAERDRKLRKEGKRHDELSEHDLHKVRIRAKQLRYAVEFFRSLYDGGAKRFHKRVVAIQERLGSLNDGVVSQALVEALRQRLAGTDAAALAAATGLVRGWQAARIDSDRRLFARDWEAYRDAERFWA